MNGTQRQNILRTYRTLLVGTTTSDYDISSPARDGVLKNSSMLRLHNACHDVYAADHGAPGIDRAGSLKLAIQELVNNGLDTGLFSEAEQEEIVKSLGFVLSAHEITGDPNSLSGVNAAPYNLPNHGY